MDACRSCKLCQPADRFFHLSRRKPSSGRQASSTIMTICGRSLGMPSLLPLSSFFELLLYPLSRGHCCSQISISVGHFRNAPLQRSRRFFGSVTTGINRCGMPLSLQLYDLGVDEDQLDFRRLRLHKMLIISVLMQTGFPGTGGLLRSAYAASLQCRIRPSFAGDLLADCKAILMGKFENASVYKKAPAVRLPSSL